MTESMYRRPNRGGDERDAFSPASRKALKWRRGEVAGIKLRARRRERRVGRQTGWAAYA